MTSKAERQELLKELILNDSKIDSHFYIQQELEKKGVPVAQSTVSKDLKEIGARSDKKSGRIIFESEIYRNEAAKKLTTLLKRSEMKVIGEEQLISLFVRVEEKFSQIVAIELVEYFKLIEIDVFVFNGLNGVIQIMTPKEYGPKVKDYIKKIQS